MSSKFASILLGALAVSLVTADGVAQTGDAASYPNRTVRIVAARALGRIGEFLAARKAA